MTTDQAIVFATLIAALILFAFGRWRYDVVALMALLAVTLTGVIDAGEAFTGFGHPAVITVAAVLVLSRALQNAGLADLVVGWMRRAGDRPTVQIASLSSVAAVSSAFMNNVGSLALFMPVAIRMARRVGRAPSYILMPLAFASLLGGLLTMIGTPPNIIIGTFRAEVNGEPFRMFDFTPVGAGVAVAGVIFITLIGWRLIPQRKGAASREEMFHIEDYITEVRVPEDSKLAGRALRDVERTPDVDAVVVGLVRGERSILAPSSFETIRPDDILIVKADSASIQALVDDLGLELVGKKDTGEEAALGSDEVTVMEAIVTPNSVMENRTPRGLNLRWRYGINLLAVARQGVTVQQRLRNIRFRAGDVLLLQGRSDILQDALTTLGCLPLAERGLRIGEPRRLLLAAGIFAAAIVAAATGLTAIQVAFVAAAVAMILTGLLTLRQLYDAIDWPVIILLGAMIPVGFSLETTGGAELIADNLLGVADDVPPVLAIAMLLIATMFLSDIINNAAAAVLMAPISINIAAGLDASADPFLMAVAVGASSAFLTPIGHQSNTLVMGPGGYRFGDYWRMGLPLQAIIVAVAVPLIMIVWPP